MPALIYLALLIGLFVAAFVMKRRFGLLGLALAAGYMLSSIWGYDAGLVAGVFSVQFTPLSSAIVSCIVILLPAVLLLFHGNTYKTIVGRVIGAALFAVLAMAFLIEPLSHVIVVQGFGSNVFYWLLANKNTLIGIGLVAAIIDLFLTKPAHSSDKHHKH